MLLTEKATTKPYDLNGYRIFVSRYYTKNRLKELHIDFNACRFAPSSDLYNWYHNIHSNFKGFSSEYIKELNSNPHTEHLMNLVQKHLKNSHNVILVYTHNDPKYNSAVILKHYFSILLGLKKPKLTTLQKIILKLYNDKYSNNRKNFYGIAKIARSNKKLFKDLHLKYKNKRIYYKKNPLTHEQFLEHLLEQNKKA